MERSTIILTLPIGPFFIFSIVLSNLVFQFHVMNFNFNVFFYSIKARREDRDGKKQEKQLCSERGKEGFNNTFLVLSFI